MSDTPLTEFADNLLNTKQSKPCACEGGTLVRFIQPCILSLLSEEPCHGYDLLRRLGELEMLKDNPPDTSGVYRVLHSMEDRGLVSSEIVYNGKKGLGRKVFTLTDKGRECRRKWIATLNDYRKDINEVITLLQKQDEFEKRPLT